MLLIILLQALCWGGSVFLVNNGTLLVYTIHTLFLYSTCVLFTISLASVPTMAYCFLTISLGPMLFVLFFLAPVDITPLTYCLLVLTILLGVTIRFHSMTLHAAIRKHIQDQRTLHDLKTRLQTYTVLSDSFSAVSVLNDFRIELQKFSEQKTTEAMARNEAIWDTILTITNQSHLQDNWHHCFSGKLANLCRPLESDRIYIAEADKGAREAPTHSPDKYQASIDHSWIFNNSDCVALLKKGRMVHNQSPQLSEQQQKALKGLGVKAFLDIPILLKQELWGIIGMERLTNATPFTPQQIKGLQFIANILAMTIRNQQDRTERNRLATVIEQSSDCTLITDPAGRILYANPACETITGYSHSELMGTNIQKLHPETGRDSNIWQQISTALKNGERWQGQFTNHRKDHALYEEEMLLSPAYDHEGRIATQVIVKRNITEKKRLESIVEAANLMDNIGFIFSSIRHELGNPINSIKVSLSVLDSNLELYDKNNIKRFINRSLADIVRVEYLLKTLKNFSIFERPIIERTDMTTLLNKFIALIATDLQRKNIRLTAAIPKEPSIGMIDPRAFQQVLLNLIANAADALTETEQKNISLTMLKEENGQINIIIGDNGCGISDVEQASLFKPFFTTKPQGTGLGLVIVKKMLSKMNCSIDIRSKSDKGTKVLIVIPGC
ncbi:MAG: PAS domain S-box protein [Desulfoarculaceae bacterium]|nr:PAS domain S-box protein [Desulfoarculaceae bacterium]